VDEDSYAAITVCSPVTSPICCCSGTRCARAARFFDSFGKDAADWHCITISAFDCPSHTGEQVSRDVRRRLISKRWVERAAKRGIDSNEYQVRVLGRFPSESEDTVVSLGDLQTAQAQNFEPGLPLIIGVDVARFGSDHTVVALRQGNWIRVLPLRKISGGSIPGELGRTSETVRRTAPIGFSAAHQCQVDSWSCAWHGVFMSLNASRMLLLPFGLLAVGAFAAARPHVGLLAFAIFAGLPLVRSLRARDPLTVTLGATLAGMLAIGWVVPLRNDLWGAPVLGMLVGLCDRVASASLATTLSESMGTS
jgi:hypothetical protein